MIELTCPSCSKAYKVKDDAAGKVLGCKCGKKLRIPAKTAAPSPPAATPAASKPSVDDDDFKLELAPEDGAPSASSAPSAPPVTPSAPTMPEINLVDDELTLDTPTPAQPKPPTPAAPPGMPVPPGMPDGISFDDDDSGSSFDDGPSVMDYVLGIVGIAVTVAVVFYVLGVIDVYKAKKAYLEGLNAITDKEFDQGREHMELSVSKYDQWPAPHFILGWLYLRDGQKEDAAKAYEKALRLRPNETLAAATHGALALTEDDIHGESAKSHLSDAAEAADYKPNQLIAALVNQPAQDEAFVKALEALGAKDATKGWDKSADGTLRWLQLQHYESTNKHEALQKAALPLTANLEGDEAKRLSHLMMSAIRKGPFEPKGPTGKMVNQVSLLIKQLPEEEQKNLTLALAPFYHQKGQSGKALAALDATIDPSDVKGPFFILYRHVLMDTIKAQAASLSDEGLNGEERKEAQGAQDELIAKAVPVMASMLSEASHREAADVSMVINALIFLEKHDTETFSTHLATAREAYPDHPVIQRYSGNKLIEEGKYVEGIAQLRKALAKDEGQEDLKAQLESYKGDPTFSDFRPSKPEDFVGRPLLHIRVKSGSVFPIDYDGLSMTLDGEEVEFTRGGNELFYRPAEDLSSDRHTVKVTARDLAGNSASQTFSFNIDTEMPEAKLVDEQPYKKARPIVRVQLSDKVSDVFDPSVVIIMKHAEGNPNRLSDQPVYNGLYTRPNAALERESKTPIDDNGLVELQPVKDLKSGTYELHISMRDVIGNAGKLVVPFTVDTGEAPAAAEGAGQ